jgi:hypothetical protein
MRKIISPIIPKVPKIHIPSLIRKKNRAIERAIARKLYKI